MIQGIYAVYDEGARVFCRPFYCPNDQVAVRAFAAAANVQDNDVGRFPNHMTLFKLGEFNDEKGGIVAYPQQLNLGKGIDHVRQNASQPIRDEAQLFAGAKGGDPAQ